MAATRHLAAILAADVAGYSRLVGGDEEGTLARLRAHRRELIDPKISEHQGRIVSTAGDGLLAEFPSVVDAMRCATEVQRGMLDRDADIEPHRRIQLRIGINLGDVVAEDGDILGTGVNIAARLEALAEPGGICVSRTFHEQIRDRMPFKLDDMGEHSVHNIARPVRAYALNRDAIAHLPRPNLPAAIPVRRLGRRVVMSFAAAGAAVIIAIAVWSVWSGRAPLTLSTVVTAGSTIATPRLSIAVLPFANL